MRSRGAGTLCLESDKAHWPLPGLAFRCFDWDSLEYGIPKGLGRALAASRGPPGSGSVWDTGLPLAGQQWEPPFRAEAPSAAGQ